MSKLRDDPARVVPMRVLVQACLLTGAIGGLSMLLEFDLRWTLIFFWLATVANLIAFRLIVAGADRMMSKKEAGMKTTIIPNLMIRYVMYMIVLASAWLLGGFIPTLAAFMGVQMSQIAIKLDRLVG